jgi:uncharacterized protein YjbI with pentapeptide repeats
MDWNLIARWKHRNKIELLKKKYAKVKKEPTVFLRSYLMLIAGITTIGLMLIFNIISWNIVTSWVPTFIKSWMPKIAVQDTKSLINISSVLITAPILFVIWAFRDQNRLRELENQRKDTNLKEFQKLQEWATGSTDNIVLQISALNSLRGYLKGEYGESFRRGAFEIFVSALSTVHEQMFTDIAYNEKTTLQDINLAIKDNKLCQQLNRIVEEEWFNLLINHNFPTANISLVGIRLGGAYLRHRVYGKALDLSGASLQGVGWTSVQLQGANLENANLQKALFIGVQFQNANLKASKLQGANFHYEYLKDLKSEAEYTEAINKGVILKGTEFQGTDFEHAELQETYLVDAQLQGANLMYTQLQGANLSGTQLQGANMACSSCQKTILSSANLRGANLIRSNLEGANLSGTQLQGADLTDTKLQETKLGGAQLQGVYVCPKYSLLTFEKRVKQQIGKKTDIDGLKKQYQASNKAEKAGVILDLSEATIGTYSKEDAKRWITDYKQATE